MSNSAYEQKLGHGADSARIRDVYVRDGHGYWTGAAVRWNSSLDSWDLADANSVTGAESVGIVEVRDTYRFDVVLSGSIHKLFEGLFSPGKVYFLSKTPGVLTSEPEIEYEEDNNFVEKAMLITTDLVTSQKPKSYRGYVVNYRGVVPEKESCALFADNIHPVGVVQPFAGSFRLTGPLRNVIGPNGQVSEIPFGWLECDGSFYSKNTYSDLFDVIGYTYGSNLGGSQFAVPDMRDRTVIGALITGADQRGVTGGTKNIVLGSGTDLAEGATFDDTIIDGNLEPFSKVRWIVRWRDEPEVISAYGCGGQIPFRNHIDNGSFDIWQRGNSFVTGLESKYTADRWFYNVGQCSGSSSDGTVHFNVNRGDFDYNQTVVPDSPNHYMNFKGYISGSNNQGSEYVILEQRIPGVRTLAGKKATLSFWMKGTESGRIAVNLKQHFGYQVQLCDSESTSEMPLAGDGFAGDFFSAVKPPYANDATITVTDKTSEGKQNLSLRSASSFTKKSVEVTEDALVGKTTTGFFVSEEISLKQEGASFQSTTAKGKTAGAPASISDRGNELSVAKDSDPTVNVDSTFLEPPGIFGSGINTDGSGPAGNDNSDRPEDGPDVGGGGPTDDDGTVKLSCGSPGCISCQFDTDLPCPPGQVKLCCPKQWAEQNNGQCSDANCVRSCVCVSQACFDCFEEQVNGASTIPCIGCGTPCDCSGPIAQSPSPTPTNTPTSTPTQTPTPTQTQTPTPTVTPSISVSVTPSQTPTPSATPTVTPSASAEWGACCSCFYSGGLIYTQSCNVVASKSICDQIAESENITTTFYIGQECSFGSTGDCPGAPPVCVSPTPTPTPTQTPHSNCNSNSNCDSHRNSIDHGVSDTNSNSDSYDHPNSYSISNSIDHGVSKCDSYDHSNNYSYDHSIGNSFTITNTHRYSIGHGICNTYRYSIG